MAACFKITYVYILTIGLGVTSLRVTSLLQIYIRFLKIIPNMLTKVLELNQNQKNTTLVAMVPIGNTGKTLFIALFCFLCHIGRWLTWSETEIWEETFKQAWLGLEQGVTPQLQRLLLISFGQHKTAVWYHSYLRHTGIPPIPNPGSWEQRNLRDRKILSLGCRQRLLQEGAERDITSRECVHTGLLLYFLTPPGRSGRSSHCATYFQTCQW